MALAALKREDYHKSMIAPFLRIIYSGLVLLMITSCANFSVQSNYASFPIELYSFLFPPIQEKTLKETALIEIQYYAKPRQVRALNRMSSAEDINNFLDEFWKQFDPTPGTLKNEFRIEHNRRTEIVKSCYPARRGWSNSDRGRVYILYGPPVA